MNLDLNLLTALDALLEEGSVGGAARRLHLSEPATSRALGRIRAAIGDPILVRSGRRMVLTPRAVELRTEVRALVERAQAVFTPPGPPDPATLQRVFTVLADDVATALGPELLARVQSLAAGVTLRFLGEDPASDGTVQLRDGRADLDIGVVDDAPPEITVEPLFTDRMTAVVRAGHPLLRGPLTPRRYAEAVHVSASRRGRLTGPIDEALAEHGLTRRVALAVPTFGAALIVVARTDLVGLMPARLGRPAIDALGLIAVDPPIPLPPKEIAMAWHQRYTADGTHAWLRARVRETIASLAAT
ncbi:LysR family transcriptional regulator [Actinoplanes sp. SE50]|uniref:LysR family transcriptional regulator n=1 Tax=unclassified Actinoplanes TaxID=2626549 RepID=UPI00023ED11E|nr:MULTISPECIES: LysR family transcriptional regulator [unclassified Actinoplanes]AEV87257.1 putative RuBisCO transcriptional regulator [Actinoplanes sp. SE50/110]ATO85657.1 LysR family transcriptional regulator [Actinoplanes sp. SE50]SLM03070.1 LysR-family transcriptional regulator [Actinoplanes sp. SE50/110]